MKNMMKKTFAALAALVLMLSVVIAPCSVENDEKSSETSFELWDDDSRRN